MEAHLSHTTLHYKTICDKYERDTVVLFLHEALGSIGQWKSFPERLCEALELPGIIYERQGHGNSSELDSKRNAQYLHNYALKELPEFLSTIGENRSLLLVGHSDGGTIALLFASKFPDQVKGVITMAAHVVNEPETIQGIAPAVKAYEAGKLNGLEKYHGAKTNTLFYAWADIWRSEVFKTWNIVNEIAGCSQPGIFIQGANDQYGTAKQLELITANYKGPCTALFIDNCGHHPHLEQEEQVIANVLEYSSKLKL